MNFHCKEKYFGKSLIMNVYFAVYVLSSFSRFNPLDALKRLSFFALWVSFSPRCSFAPSLLSRVFSQLLVSSHSFKREIFFSITIAFMGTFSFSFSTPSFFAIASGGTKVCSSIRLTQNLDGDPESTVK